MQRDWYLPSITNLKNGVHQINDGTTDGSDWEKAQTTPGSNDANDESHEAGNRRQGGFDHTGKSHDGQRDVRHIVQ